LKSKNLPITMTTDVKWW